ncbi:MAG: hypothetical protein NVSMB62_22670 [Acidobacteriaceae bacterium]
MGTDKLAFDAFGRLLAAGDPAFTEVLLLGSAWAVRYAKNAMESSLKPGEELRVFTPMPRLRLPGSRASAPPQQKLCISTAPATLNSRCPGTARTA